MDIRLGNAIAKATMVKVIHSKYNTKEKQLNTTISTAAKIEITHNSLTRFVFICLYTVQFFKLTGGNGIDVFKRFI